MIKAIIFDSGGVMVKYSGKVLRKNLSMHLNVNREKLWKAYKTVISEFVRGKISEREFWKRVAKQIGITISQNKWKNFLENEFRDWAVTDEKMKELAVSLKMAGYKIALLSNTIKPHVRYAKKRGWYKIFPIKVFSCEVGFEKPDREIYLLILKKLKVKPEEAIFIDNRKTYVNGARKLGIKTILFKNINQLKKDLAKVLGHGV